MLLAEPEGRGEGAIMAGRGLIGLAIRLSAGMKRKSTFTVSTLIHSKYLTLFVSKLTSSCYIMSLETRQNANNGIMSILTSGIFLRYGPDTAIVNSNEH